MSNTPQVGQNVIIGKNVSFGKNVVIKNNCIIEDDVVLEDGVYIDNNSLIRNDTHLGENSTVGANCIIGEYQMDFFRDHKSHKHELIIGRNAIIRSGSILYNGSAIGDNFQTGHQVTIREKAEIGNNVSIGTRCDIQGYCKLGNYIRLQSNVLVSMSTQIDDCVWIFPYVILPNDPNPPSDNEFSTHIHSFAILASGAVLLPGVEIHNDALIGAGAVVTKDVNRYEVVVGNPAKVKGDVRNIKDHVSGELYYPWRYHFDRSMPWAGFGFDDWFASLDDDYKKLLLG